MCVEDKTGQGRFAEGIYFQMKSWANYYLPSGYCEHQIPSIQYHIQDLRGMFC